MNMFLWLFLAVCLIVALLTIADRLEERRQRQRSLRMVDQQREERQRIVESWQQAKHELEDARERRRLSVVAKTGSSR